MARHFEKGIERAREAIASVGEPRDDPEPWSRERVMSFVKGFGIRDKAAQRMVDAWMKDQQRARDAGWESHADSVYYDEW